MKRSEEKKIIKGDKPVKIVVAADSFKGSMSSAEIGKSVQKGIRKIFPQAEIIIVPVADGGEGTVEALVDGTNGQYKKVIVNGPLMTSVSATYGITGDGRTAVIEMASASGLPLVPDREKNPMKTTTFGTGELIKNALSNGCREFLIGIGGSATNDCGMGMMQALGLKFLDKEGNELGQGGQNLIKTDSIDKSNILNELSECRFLIACDVENPLYGENGAAHIYSRQKGADEPMVLELDKGLRHFSEIVKNEFNFDMNDLPGSGAAGGLGGGFAAFLNGILKPGIDIVLEKTNLAEKIKGADFVITGEGRIDFQSIMGKTPVGVSKLAEKQGIPVIAIAGAVADDAGAVHDHGITSLFSIMNYPAELKEVMEKNKALLLVEKNIEEIFRLIKVCRNN